MRLPSILIVFCGLLGACASSGPVMLGPARPAITPDQVKIYWSPPAAFEPIADLNASSHSVFTPGGQQVMDKVIAQLKVEAANG
jgi:hypothetical protein